jgi:hypothetical protein
MANKTKRQQVLFEYLVDQQATQRVGAANKQIEDGFTRMQKAIQRGGIAGTQELKKLEKESRDALGDINDLRRGVAKLDATGAKAFDAQIDSLKDFQKQIKLAQGDVRDFDEEFSQARQRVALAGDVEAQTRTLGGAVGAFGGAGGRQIEMGVATLSEIPASLEAIGSLGPAIKGVPDVLKSVAGGLGLTGIGIGAAAILAIGTFAALSKGMNESAKAAQELVDVQKTQAKTGAELEQALIKGDIESVAAQIGATLNQRELAQLELAQLERDLFNARVAQIMEEKNLNQQAAEEFVRAMSEVDLRSKFDDANRLDEKLDDLINPDQTIFQIRKLQDAVDELHTGPLRELEFNFGRQGELLDKYGVSLIEVLDIVNASTEVEEDRGAAILAQAEIARTTFLREQALLEQSTEQLNDRLAAIENERAANELAVQELEDSGQATEEVTAKLEQYKQTLSDLGQEQEFINQQALETARIREMEADQAERLKEAEEEKTKAQEEFAEQAEKALQERADLEKKFADDLVSISERAAEESEKALDGLNKKLGDLNRQLQTDIANQQIKNDRKLLEAQVKAQRAERDEFVKHRRTLLDIQEDAADQELDLQQARDFRGVFNLRRSTRKRIQSEQKDMQRRLNDQALERARNRTDMLKAFQDERNDRLRKFNQDINDTNRQFAIEQAMARQNAINAINTRRQQFGQELSDLMMASGQYLNLRRQGLTAEMGLLQAFTSTAASMLGQLQNQQAQVAGSANGIAAFGAGALGAGAGTTTTETTTNAPITINQSPQQSGMEAARATHRVLQRMAR